MWWVFRKDDSCHNYLIPESKAKRFDDLIGRIETAINEAKHSKLCNAFDAEFGEYETGCSAELYRFKDPEKIV